MDALMEREHLTMNGRHHENYLRAVSEQRPPQEIKTILRLQCGRSIDNSACPPPEGKR
jgi:hypothetical protein